MCATAINSEQKSQFASHTFLFLSLKSVHDFVRCFFFLLLFLFSCLVMVHVNIEYMQTACCVNGKSCSYKLRAAGEWDCTIGRLCAHTATLHFSPTHIVPSRVRCCCCCVAALFENRNNNMMVMMMMMIYAVAVDVNVKIRSDFAH